MADVKELVDWRRKLALDEVIGKEINKWIREKLKDFVDDFWEKQGFDYERDYLEPRRKKKFINDRIWTLDSWDGDEADELRENCREVLKKIKESEKIKNDGDMYAANKLLPIVQEETQKIALEYNITEEEANQLASDAVKRVKKKAGIKDESKKKAGIKDESKKKPQKRTRSEPKGTGTSSRFWIPPLKSGGAKYGEYVDLGGYQR